MVGALSHLVLAFALAIMAPLSQALLAVERLMAPQLDAGCRQRAPDNSPRPAL
jgi:hypothetical protein